MSPRSLQTNMLTMEKPMRHSSRLHLPHLVKTMDVEVEVGPVVDVDDVRLDVRVHAASICLPLLVPGIFSCFTPRHRVASH